MSWQHPEHFDVSALTGFGTNDVTGLLTLLCPGLPHRDAYEVCSMIPDPSERHQCYSVFGLDAQRMAAYYDTVVRLEHQLSSDLDSPGEEGPGAERWEHSLSSLAYWRWALWCVSCVPAELVAGALLTMCGLAKQGG